MSLHMLLSIRLKKYGHMFFVVIILHDAQFLRVAPFLLTFSTEIVLIEMVSLVPIDSPVSRQLKFVNNNILLSQAEQQLWYSLSIACLIIFNFYW